MDIKKFIDHKLINKSELAAALFPNVIRKSAKDKLYQKSTGYDGRKFSPEEEERLQQIWEAMKKKIDQPI